MRSYVHGITPEQFEAMLAEQENCCAICGMEGWLGGRHPGSPHVDHDHRTGQIRGLLCAACNLGLGRFNDDPERLRAAAEYLLRYR